MPRKPYSSFFPFLLALLQSPSVANGLATPRRGRRRPPSNNKKGGFSKPAEEASGSPKSTTNESSAAEAKRIYSMPALYDLAFGYRNFEEEVDFLIGQHQTLNQGTSPHRTLELAAGPARHTITALQSEQIQDGIALDNSGEMKDYATDIAQHELDVDSLEKFSYQLEDMANFDLSSSVSGPIDSAWILLGSLQHLTKNEQVVSCFKSIHKALAPGGTLIIELPHPRETFSLVECTRNGWEIPLEDENGDTTGELEIIWGDDNDDFDPIAQVRQFTVAMELKGMVDNDASPSSVREIVPMRLFTAQEIDALACLAGFRVRSMHGALSDDVEVNDDIEAFRLVTVLQKV